MGLSGLGAIQAMLASQSPGGGAAPDNAPVDPQMLAQLAQAGPQNVPPQGGQSAPMPPPPVDSSMAGSPGAMEAAQGGMAQAQPVSGDAGPGAMESMMAGLQGSGAGASEVKGQPPQATASQPPKIGMPIAYNLVKSFFGSHAPGPDGVRPPSRTNAFENFMGQFMDSFSQGLAASGHGPGANMRGAAAAMRGPYNTAVDQYGRQQQAQAQQAQVQGEQAKTALTQAQASAAPAEAAARLAAQTAQPRLDPITKQYVGVMNDKQYQEYIKGQGAQNVKAASSERVAKINQGIQMPVPEDIAKMVGMPELANTRVGKAAWAEINSRLASQGKDLQITDVGANRVLMRKSTGDVVRTLGQAPNLTARVAGAQASAQAHARWAPFQTTDEEGNPITTTAEQAIKTGAPSLSVWNSVYGPTGSTKSQAQAAGSVAEHIPEFKKSIDALAKKGQLGPTMGRLNTFLTKGYGGDDADVSEFVTTVGLLKSGAVRAHFGAKGGQQILEKFDSLLNTAQTPEALKGSIDGIGKFLTTYKSTGTPKPPRTNIPAVNAAPAGANSVINDLIAKHGPKSAK